MRFMQRVLVALTALSSPIVTGAVLAQRIPPPAASSEGCQTAIRSLGENRQPETWLVLAACGDAGIQALAAKLRSTSGDLQAEAAEYLLGVLSMVRSPMIAEAAAQVIQDPGAPVFTRVLALLAGLGQHFPGAQLDVRIPLAQLLAGESASRCPIAWGVAADPVHTEGRLRVDHLDAYRVALRALASEASAPAGLRQLAVCAYSITGPVPTPPTAIRLEYVCGNRFRVVNDGDDPISVRYRVGDGGLSGGLAVGARSQTEWTVTSSGTVTLIYDGAELATRQNQRIACPTD